MGRGGGVGWGIFEPQAFFFVIKFLVWFFLGHSMNIFYGLLARMIFFFHFFIFPCANIFVVLRPPPPAPPTPPPSDKFSNGPSLNVTTIVRALWLAERSVCMRVNNYVNMVVVHGLKLWSRAQLLEGRLALNPGLNLTWVLPGFLFLVFLCVAFSRIIFSVIFRASNHHLVDKKN